MDKNVIEHAKRLYGLNLDLEFLGGFDDNVYLVKTKML